MSESPRDAIEQIQLREHSVRYITTLQEYYERFKLEGSPEGVWVKGEINKVKSAFASLPSASGAITSTLQP